mmetsp:Transcript_233/g.290  ORF Transcript_233/g.290 Transcript_233/m.290 type:complete len:284 (+) Transcript_233:236-1087(+)|eukprot:CAMPEP_0184023522 /NCGR_PEP_ID=MMETSP0954-20121128/11421_1 /TAXON_ID=627963 /ORGANISM="Aplanochytrium sp, Strain PBS07" /LENGTH=283 /DNA_ID=CAMNT_0026306443 /DNA_START=296 /DNA_END=1147 /DNA_ORIENTATION=-
MTKQLYQNLYRACLREVKQFKRPLPLFAPYTESIGATETQADRQNSIFITDPLFTQGYGRGRHTISSSTIVERIRQWSGVRDSFELSNLQTWARELDVGPRGSSITVRQFCDLLRLEFETSKTDKIPGSDKIERAFAAIQVIREMLELDECTTLSTSNGVSVELTTRCVFNEPENFFFCYRIRVSNSRPEKVTLKGRAWKFFSIKDNEEPILCSEVARFEPGVVGQQPVIEDTMVFEYVSGAQLPTQKGYMEGAFQFENNESGELFEVELIRTNLWAFGSTLE